MEVAGSSTSSCVLWLCDTAEVQLRKFRSIYYQRCRRAARSVASATVTTMITDEFLIVLTGEFIRSLSDYSIVYPEKVFGDRVRRSDGIRLRSTFCIALAGESLLLDLHQSSQFISPRLVIHRYVDGRVVEESLSEDSLLCHYIGEVRGHRLSSAAVSICGGLVSLCMMQKEIRCVGRTVCHGVTV